MVTGWNSSLKQEFDAKQKINLFKILPISTDPARLGLGVNQCKHINQILCEFHIPRIPGLGRCFFSTSVVADDLYLPIIGGFF